ncbi:hypothetical protein OIV83_002664 [Microbotryomycetes sp. JL201]|nr:hypothetical protein OIV83_002664 [Microbotryomycetes sp. JL201]
MSQQPSYLTNTQQQRQQQQQQHQQQQQQHAHAHQSQPHHHHLAHQQQHMHAQQHQGHHQVPVSVPDGIPVDPSFATQRPIMQPLASQSPYAPAWPQPATTNSSHPVGDGQGHGGILQHNSSAQPLPPLVAHGDQQAQMPPKRKRGRPRKNPLPDGRPPPPPPAPGSAPRGRPRGRPRGSRARGGRGRGRGAKRARNSSPEDDFDLEDNESNEEEDQDDDNVSIGNDMNEDDMQDDYTGLEGLPSTTKSGRKISRPTPFVPTIKPTIQRRKRGSMYNPDAFLMCQVCKEGHSAPANKLVICDACSKGWHQLCHEPNIQDELVNSDVPFRCKECDLKLAKSRPDVDVTVGEWSSNAEFTAREKQEWLENLPLHSLVNYVLSIEQKYSARLQTAALEIWPQDLPGVLARAREQRLAEEEERKRREEEEEQAARALESEAATPASSADPAAEVPLARTAASVRASRASGLQAQHNEGEEKDEMSQGQQDLAVPQEESQEDSKDRSIPVKQLPHFMRQAMAPVPALAAGTTSAPQQTPNYGNNNAFAGAGQQLADQSGHPSYQAFQGGQAASNAQHLQDFNNLFAQLEQGQGGVQNLQSDHDSHKVLLRLNTIDSAASFEPSDAQRALWSALWPYFARGQDAPAELVVEPVLPSQTLHDALVGIASTPIDDSYRVHRSAMFQLYTYAINKIQPAPYPAIFNGDARPARPPKPCGDQPIYTRLIPHLDQLFRLQPCTQNHLNVLHSWMNDARVDKFWEEKGTIEQHEKFIADRTADPHTLSVIGSYVTNSGDKISTSEPQLATYSEIYWVKEDRLGPLISHTGLHMLVGSDAHRGPHRVRAWLPSLVHYCFLDDPRTDRVVCEPNAKNAKMIEYLESVGFERHGDVQFPHKVAALMIVEKARFYCKCPF